MGDRRDWRSGSQLPNFQRTYDIIVQAAQALTHVTNVDDHGVPEVRLEVRQTLRELLRWIEEQENGK